MASQTLMARDHSPLRWLTYEWPCHPLAPANNRRSVHLRADWGALPLGFVVARFPGGCGCAGALAETMNDLRCYSHTMKTTTGTTLFVIGLLAAFDGFTSPQRASWSGQTTREQKMTSAKGIVLEGEDKLVSPDSFRPPVEITIVAKTDSTDLRIGYVADQVIFNWRDNPDQLRVDGGPAGNQAIDGVGRIPKNQYVDD